MENHFDDRHSSLKEKILQSCRNAVLPHSALRAVLPFGRITALCVAMLVYLRRQMGEHRQPDPTHEEVIICS